ncbi:hypothetical protein D3C73_1542340 [compost metagenome]
MATPPEKIVRMEWKKVSLEISRPPAPIISASDRKIITPTFSGTYRFINLASRSVPPVLALNRSISPSPLPIRKPPIMALEIDPISM